MRALLVLLLGACLSQRPDVFDGVSADAVCSWDLVHTDRGQCMADGHRFRCVRRVVTSGSAFWNHVSCVPYRVWK